MVSNKVWELALKHRKEMGLSGETVGVFTGQDSTIRDIDAVVDDVMAELFQDAVTLSETAVLTFRQAYRGVPNMAGKMMDQRVRDLTDRIYSIGPDRGPYCFRLSEYNLVAQNREVFAQMLEEAPGLLRFYCLYLAPERASPADQPGEKARGNLVFDHPWEVPNWSRKGWASALPSGVISPGFGPARKALRRGEFNAQKPWCRRSGSGPVSDWRQPSRGWRFGPQESGET